MEARRPRDQLGWRRIREEYLDALTRRGVRLGLKTRTWAVGDGDAWVVLPATTESPADEWFLGFGRAEYVARKAAGAILLCRTATGELLDFGLSAAVLARVLPHLSTQGERELKLKVRRRGKRFVLMVPRQADLDITTHLHDVDWLGAGPDIVAETEAAYREPPSDADDVRYFARVEKGVLRPVDPVELPEGAAFLVVLRPVADVPSVSAFRRILAGGGATGLPADFAEEHDHYAHGSPRRRLV